MSLVYRHLHLVGATSADIRTATFDGREHLVVPVVALMEGVIWPVNAPTREFVSAEVLAIAPQAWNGEPVVMDHPVSAEGRKISANDPHVLERYAYGQIFNTASSEEVLRTKRLSMEAWLDVARAARVGKDAQDVLRRAQEKEPIEVSVGAFIVGNEHAGEYNGVKYGLEWMQVMPDHLATLPQGSTGACSVEMGCGAPRTAKGRAMVHLVTARGFEIQQPEQQKVSLQIDGKQIAELLLPELTVKGAGMKTREERIAALIASGRLTPAALQACEGAISDDDLSTLEAALAAAKDGEQIDVPQPAKKRTLRQRFMDLLNSWRGADGMSDVELRDALDRALRSTVPGYIGIAAVFADEKQVVYGSAPEESLDFWRCSYTAGSDGTVSLADAREKVKRVEKWEAMSAEPTANTQRTACGCQGGAEATTTAASTPANPQGDTHMDKAQRIKALIDNPKTPWKAADQSYLEGMSEDRLKEVEQHAAPAEEDPTKKKENEGQPAAVPQQQQTTPAATPAAQPQQVAAAATEETEEQQIAKLPKSLRAMVERAQASERARKTALITTLKSAQTEYTEQELQDMPIDGLERMSRLLQAEVDVPAADFTGRGFPRAAAAVGDYLSNPPSGYDKALEKRTRKE